MVRARHTTGDPDVKFTPRPFPAWMYEQGHWVDRWRGYGEMLNTYAVQEAGQQFGVLAPALGSSFASCTLTHNSLTFTFGASVLTNLDAISGAASTGTAGTASYTQAVFSIASVSVSGGNDGDDGGDDGGWNRITNTQGSTVPVS